MFWGRRAATSGRGGCVRACGRAGGRAFMTQTRVDVGRQGGSKSRAGFHALARPLSVVPLSPLPFAAPEGGLTAPQASASSPFQSTPSSSTHPQPGSIAPQSWPWHAASPAHFFFFPSFFPRFFGRFEAPKTGCSVLWGLVWFGLGLRFLLLLLLRRLDRPSVRSLACFTRAGLCWSPVT